MGHLISKISLLVNLMSAFGYGSDECISLLNRILWSEQDGSVGKVTKVDNLRLILRTYIVKEEN